MGVIVMGDRAFKDSGLLGAGVPGYSRHSGYSPSRVPTAVGARYFGPRGNRAYDDVTDQEIPLATGNKWDGGKAVYRQRVYNAAKKDWKELGFSRQDITDLSKMPGVTGPGV